MNTALIRFCLFLLIWFTLDQTTVEPTLLSTFSSNDSDALFQSLSWISMPWSIIYWTGFPVIRLHMQQLFKFCFHCFNSNQPQPLLANSPNIIALFTCSFKYFVSIFYTNSSFYQIIEHILMPNYTITVSGVFFLFLSMNSVSAFF